MEPRRNAKSNEQGAKIPNRAPTKAHTRKNDAIRTDEAPTTGRTVPEDEK